MLLLSLLATAQCADLKETTIAVTAIAAAIFEPEKIQEGTCKGCRLPQFKRLKDRRLTMFNEETLFWLTAYDPVIDSIVIAHRGTDSLLNNFHNLLSDLYDCDQDWCSGTRVHRGLYTAVKPSIRLLAKDIGILKSKYPKKPLVFAGYSSGAAYATFSALILAKKGLIKPQESTIFAIGGPRIGNEAFGQLLDKSNFKQIYRVVNPKDIIGIIPPESYGYPTPCYGTAIYVDKTDNGLELLQCQKSSRHCQLEHKDMTEDQLFDLFGTNLVPIAMEHFRYPGVTFRRGDNWWLN
jgi:hypothetical protein